MTKKLHNVHEVCGKAICGMLVLPVALLAGCISGDGADKAREADIEAVADIKADNEAAEIVETIKEWLASYATRLGVSTEHDGDVVYVRGQIGELPSIFSTFGITFLIDSEEREVVCFGYLPTTVSEERRGEMAEFIFRGEWEYGISTASMVLDSDGRVRCQAWAPFESFSRQPQETQWRLVGAVVDKLWSFSDGVALVSLGVDAETAASELNRIASFEGGEEAERLANTADVDTKEILEACFDEDDGITLEENDDEWLDSLAKSGGEASVGIIQARIEDILREIGGRYDVLPYVLIVREGVVWNFCCVPEVCPEEKRREMALRLMEMNESLKYMLFGMDFATGKMWCHYAVPVSAIPKDDERPPRNLYGALIKFKTVQRVAENSEELHSFVDADEPECDAEVPTESEGDASEAAD